MANVAAPSPSFGQHDFARAKNSSTAALFSASVTGREQPARQRKKRRQRDRGMERRRDGGTEGRRGGETFFLCGLSVSPSLHPSVPLSIFRRRVGTERC